MLSAVAARLQMSRVPQHSQRLELVITANVRNSKAHQASRHVAQATASQRLRPQTRSSCAFGTSPKHSMQVPSSNSPAGFLTAGLAAWLDMGADL